MAGPRADPATTTTSISLWFLLASLDSDDRSGSSLAVWVRRRMSRAAPSGPGLPLAMNLRLCECVCV